MDALKFLNEKRRMCNLCGMCADCPMGAESSLECRYIDFAKQVSVVEKWSKEHPAKTRMSEFLKKYPNAKLTSDGVPNILPCDFDDRFLTSGNCSKMSCVECCKKYWTEEIE